MPRIVLAGLTRTQGDDVPERFLRVKEVMARTGLARSTIYLRVQQGNFPKSVSLGSPNIVAWLESEIEKWIADTVQEFRGEVAASPSSAA